jgi:hypothetical protein
MAGRRAGLVGGDVAAEETAKRDKTASNTVTTQELFDDGSSLRDDTELASLESDVAAKQQARPTARARPPTSRGCRWPVLRRRASWLRATTPGRL